MVHHDFHHGVAILRPVNGLIGVISVFIGAVLACGKLPIALFPKIIIAGIVCFLIISAGNVLNDCIDIEIDKINKPHRPIPSGKITKRQGFLLAIGLFFIGILFSLWLSIIMFVIALFASILLILYNIRLKKQGFSGNFAVAFLGGLPFIYGGLVTEKWFLSIIPFLFAFLLHLAREILKDTEDIKGDIKGKVLSIPIKYGERRAIQLGSLILIILILLTPIPFLINLYGIYYLIGVIIFIDIPIIFVIYKTLKNKMYVPLACKILKLNMIIGLGVLLLGLIRNG